MYTSSNVYQISHSSRYNLKSRTTKNCRIIIQNSTFAQTYGNFINKKSSSIYYHHDVET